MTNHPWNGWIMLSVLAVAAVGALIWKRNKRVYLKVGRVSKILFFPVKSLRGIEAEKGKCTKLGLEVNGLLERSFMLITDDKVLLSQRQAPRLALLQPEINGSKLIISGPDVNPLTIDIKSAPCSTDKVIECKLHGDVVYVADCGDEIALWFQQYLEMPKIRLVRFFPEFPNRRYTLNNPFFQKLCKNNPVSLQDLAAFHVMSQSSIDDLNTRIGSKQVSVLNFRPNILVEDCDSYAEDSWKYMKIGNEVELVNAVPVTRCLLTTVEPDTGILTQKEPLVTLRKYRIPKDPEMLKKTGSIPCLGTACFTIQSGKIKLNDEIFATISKPLETVQK